MTHVGPNGATSDLHSHFGQRPTMTSSLRPHKTRSGRTKYHTRLPQFYFLVNFRVNFSYTYALHDIFSAHIYIHRSAMPPPVCLILTRRY